MRNFAAENVYEVTEAITDLNKSQNSLIFISSRWWNRFMFLEVILYFVPSAFYTFPLLLQEIASKLTVIFSWPWNQLAKILFGAHTTIYVAGANDNQGGYFYLLASLIFSTIAAVIWSLIEKNSHPKLNTVMVYIWKNGLRLSLAALMIWYGIMKTVPQQMHIPYPTELAQPIGEQDGYEYMWNFMGYSPLFVIIVGLIELIGGILLLIPRFITLGGYLSLGIMIPVALMNFCYDIPVKEISTQMCIGEIILLYPSLKGLTGYLIHNKTLKPQIKPKIIALAKSRIRRTCIAIYLICWVVFTGLLLKDIILFYHLEKLNQTIPLNGRWIITNKTETNSPIDPIYPQHWTAIDINATNDGNIFFKAELDPRFGNSIGTNDISIITYYNKQYIQITQKNMLNPFLLTLKSQLTLTYKVTGNTLTLSSLEGKKTSLPVLSIKAERAAPWPHHPGEFHWIQNPIQDTKDLYHTHSLL